MDVSGKCLNGAGDIKCKEELLNDSDYPPVLPLDCANEALRSRSQNLKSLLNKKFDREPSFYVKVPGRVNIIGEHIDYCGYGVLPLAIQQDILLAVAVDGLEKETSGSPLLHLTNYDDKYPDFKCPLNNFNIQKPPSWHDYFLCGVHGILHDVKDENLEGKNEEKKDVRSMYVAVHGIVPPCSGLSSSSALVSAAALATAHALKLRLSKLTLASLSARTERNVGTEGGGMDQAIAFLATKEVSETISDTLFIHILETYGAKGCAKFIDFQPLRCHDVRLPRGAAFVIAHSLVTINKAAGSTYNTRVVECRLAAQIIAKHQGIAWQKIRRLGDLEMALSNNTSKLDGLKHMLSLVENTLHEESYTKDEILQKLGVNEEELTKSSLSANTTHLKTFKLKQRALHVYAEAMRVLEFEEECLKSMKGSTCGNKNEGKTLERLGVLMNSSHSSLRDLYECSHPQLDQLVQICQEKCFGARLTGAGWGGCVVALTTDSAADDFVEHLKKNFYSGRKDFKTEEDIHSVLFRTNLESGSAVFDANDKCSELNQNCLGKIGDLCSNGR